MLGRALAVKVAQSLAISMLRCTVVSNGENSPNLSSLDVISRVSSSNFHKIHLIDVSGHCIRFTFKSCQIVAGISITSQFHVVFLISPFTFFCNENSPPTCEMNRTLMDRIIWQGFEIKEHWRSFDIFWRKISPPTCSHKKTNTPELFNEWHRIFLIWCCCFLLSK